jgi:radical SAM-linked protein
MFRLRARFSRGEPVKFISHLDIMRLWQRAFRRAGIELAYSEGFNPHPRISLAAPLPLGVTSEAELMDVFTLKNMTPHSFMALANSQLPPGVEITQVCHVPQELPSLQSRVRLAEYSVTVKGETGEVSRAIEKLLEKEALPWEHQRDTGIRSYDLRALIDDLWLCDWRGDTGEIGMRLVCSSSGSGRPEQVVKALGMEAPQAVHRTRLVLG